MPGVKNHFSVKLDRDVNQVGLLLELQDIRHESGMRLREAGLHLNHSDVDGLCGGRPNKHAPGCTVNVDRYIGMIFRADNNRAAARQVRVWIARVYVVISRIGDGAYRNRSA